MTNDTPGGRLVGLSEHELLAAEITTDTPRLGAGTLNPNVLAAASEKPDVPSADTIRAAALGELPSLLRAISELEASLRRDWWTAYRHYRLCLARWTNHYHEHDKIQITAARIKAEMDDDVINAMVESRQGWEAWQTARRARINVKAELRVRTTPDRDAIQ
jgi:hypothetical protein